jgi:hypothetical protein
MSKASSKPIDKEAVRVLALAIGAREAARKLKLNENTVLSWAHKNDWKLPKRHGTTGKGITQSQSGKQSSPGDVYLDTLQDREAKTRDALSVAALNGAQEAAQLERVLPEAARLQALGAFVARTFGWASGAQPSVNYYGDVNTVVVCDEKRRQELIAQRQRLLEQEAKGRTIEVR